MLRANPRSLIDSTVDWWLIIKRPGEEGFFYFDSAMDEDNEQVKSPLFTILAFIVTNSI